MYNLGLLSFWPRKNCLYFYSARKTTAKAMGVGKTKEKEGKKTTQKKQRNYI